MQLKDLEETDLNLVPKDHLSQIPKRVPEKIRKCFKKQGEPELN